MLHTHLHYFTPYAFYMHSPYPPPSQLSILNHDHTDLFSKFSLPLMIAPAHLVLLLDIREESL